jgi:single-strand DNA-binding protein
MTSNASPPGDNEVFLRGRLAAPAEIRTMPSGDQLCAFRLTVLRPPGDRAKVDSIDCASTNSRVRRSVGAAAPGEVLEVTGALHRRFWRSPAGLGSRYEVAVLKIKRRGNVA